MKIETIFEQLRNNAVAIISLVIAITALGYNTWRDEHTERNRTTRLAAFEVLMHLGELQIVVNYRHYDPDNSLGNPILGWGHIALIGDLAQLLPAPAPETANNLVNVWKANWDEIRTNEASVDKISQSIDNTRAVVLKIVSELP